MIRKNTCSNCKFWKPAWAFNCGLGIASSVTGKDPERGAVGAALRRKNLPSKGQCRRYAPKPGPLTSFWTTTQDSSWCGDHDPV